MYNGIKAGPYTHPDIFLTPESLSFIERSQLDKKSSQKIPSIIERGREPAQLLSDLPLYWIPPKKKEKGKKKDNEKPTDVAMETEKARRALEQLDVQYDDAKLAFMAILAKKMGELESEGYEFFGAEHLRDIKSEESNDL